MVRKKVGDTPEIKKLNEDYILEPSEREFKLPHFYSNEFYGEHVSAALGAVNRQIDRDRARVSDFCHKDSGNPFLYREFVHANRVQRPHRESCVRWRDVYRENNAVRSARREIQHCLDA